jgi:F-type H+-transporting ATPase subunit epsilon
MDMNGHTLKIDIITPESSLSLSGVYMLILPGVQGEFGVLYGHVPSFIALSPGLILSYDQNMNLLGKIFIAGGFIEITHKSATILAEEAKNLQNYSSDEVISNLEKVENEISFCSSEEKLVSLKLKKEALLILSDLLKK